MVALRAALKAMETAPLQWQRNVFKFVPMLFPFIIQFLAIFLMLYIIVDTNVGKKLCQPC